MAAPAPPVANKFKEATAKLILVLEREWLTRRGVPLPAPTLTAQQKAEIEECFTLMDSDGSGAIDVREIIQAFGSLGFVISKDAIEELMLEADPDGSGELEFDEFLSLMGRALYHPDANGKELVASTTAGSLSFADVVRAFRRKKLIESLMRGGDARRKVVDFHEKVQVLVRAEADELRERAKTHAIFERMETQRAERERLAKVVLPASQRAARVKARLQDVVGRSLGAFEALYAAHNPSASLARLASLAASSRAAASSRGGDSSSRDCSSGEESEDSDDPLGLRRRGLLRSGSQDGADTEGGGVDSARSASPTVPLERAAKSARGGGGGVTFLTEATVEQHKDAQAQPHHGFAAPPLMRSASLNSVDSTTLRTTRRVSAAVLKYFKQLEDSTKKQEQKFDDQARLNAAFVPVAPDRSDFKQALYPSRPGSRVAQAVGASALAAAPGAGGTGDTLSPGGGPRSPSPTPMGGMRGGGGTGAGTGTSSGAGTGNASASAGGSGNGGICQHPHAWGVRSPSPSLGAGAGSWTGPGSAAVITSASGLPRVPAGAWSGSAGASAGTGGGAGASTGVRRSFDLSGSRQAMSPSPVPGGSPSLPTSRAWRQTPAFGFGSAAAAPFGWGSGVSPGAALSRGVAAGASTTALNASGFAGGVGGGAVPVPGLPQALAGLLTPEVAGVLADPRSSWPGLSSTAGTATGIGIGSSIGGAPQEPHPQPSSQGLSASGAAAGAGATQSSASGSLPALPHQHQHQHQQPPQPPRAATSLGFAREAQLATAAAAAALCAPGTSGGRNAVTPEPGALAGAMPTTAGLSQPARAGAGPMPGPITRAWVAQSKSGVNELVTPHTQRESSLKKLGSGAAAGAVPVAAAGGNGGAAIGAGAGEGPGGGGGASGGGSGTGSPRQLPAAPGATSPVGVAGLTAGSGTGAGPSTAGSLVTAAPSAAAQLGGSRSRLNLGSSTPTASSAGVAAGHSSGSRSIANGGNSFSHGPFLPVARSPATGASLSGAAAAALVGEIVSVGPAPAVVTGSISAADHDAAIRSRLRPPRVGSRAATAPAVSTSLAASAPVAFAALPMATVTEAGDEDQLLAVLDMDAILADAEVANLSASAGAVPLPGRGGSGGSCGSGGLPVSRKPADGTYPEPMAPAGVRPPPGTAPGCAGLPPPPAHRTAVSSPLPGAASAAATAPAGAAAASTAGGGAAAVSQESLRRATVSPERRGSSGAIGGTSSRPPSRALLTPASPLSLVPLPPHPHQQHPHPQHGAGPSHDGLLNHRPASPHGAPATGAALPLPPHVAAPPAPSTPAGCNVPPSPVPALPLRPASPGGSYLPRGAYMNVSNVGHGGGGGAGGGGRRPSARGAKGGGQRWSGRGFGTGTVSGTGTGAANSDAGAAGAGAGAGAGERPASAARVALTPDALLGGGRSRRRIMVTCYGQQVDTAPDGAVVVPPAPATRSPESRGGSASGDRYVVNATLVDNSGGAVGQPLQTPTPTPKGARGGRAAAAAAAAGAVAAAAAAHAVPLDLDLDQYMAQQQAMQDPDTIGAGDRADLDRQSAGLADVAALWPVGTAPNATHNQPPPLHLHGHHQRPGSRQQLYPQQHAGQNPQHQPQLPLPYRHAGTPASPQAQPAQPPTRYHQPRLSPQPLAAGGHRRAYTPPSTAAARPDSGASNLAAAHASPAGGVGATGSSAELVVPVPMAGSQRTTVDGRPPSRVAPTDVAMERVPAGELGPWGAAAVSPGMGPRAATWQQG